jgi:hypothetical protein
MDNNDLSQSYSCQELTEMIHDLEDKYEHEHDKYNCVAITSVLEGVLVIVGIIYYMVKLV